MNQTSSLSTARARSRRWLWPAGGALLLLLLIIKPPFVIKPLVSPGSGSQPAQSKGEQYAEKVWKAAPPVVQKSRTSQRFFRKLRGSGGGRTGYGRRESTNLHKVTSLKEPVRSLRYTESQAGTMILKFPGWKRRSRCKLGLWCGWHADATGAAPFDQFSNQLDYADVSKEMNTRAVKAAFAGLDPSAFPGKTITFFGAFTFDPRSKGPVLVTPVRIEQ
jgi:hypothetical protein